MHPEKDEALVQASAALAGRVGLPVVATHPVQFVQRKDFKAHEARVCISQGLRAWRSARRPRTFSPEQYFKTQDEMAALFADFPEALHNSVEIARRCSLRVRAGQEPSAATSRRPTGESIEDYLRAQAESGAGETPAARCTRRTAARNEARPRYAERLDFETATIIQMGFPGYFLIVADFINWARRPTACRSVRDAAPARARWWPIRSASPTSTRCAYDLLFERFLNPERVSMPDFDIDFCQDGRDRVIEYVKQKYGAESVSQIATFGTMAAKAVVRDVGRVLGMPYGERATSIAKLDALRARQADHAEEGDRRSSRR